MKNRAFKMYLRSLTPDEAVAHIRECLGSGGEMAYELMAEALGENWTLSTETYHDKMRTVLKHILTETDGV